MLNSDFCVQECVANLAPFLHIVVTFSLGLEEQAGYTVYMTHQHHEHTSNFLKFLMAFVIIVVGVIIYKMI
jgi:hypothetical protein